MSISCRSLLRNTGTGFALLLSVASIASRAAAAGATESFDLVLKGGRVIDPDTGLDATRDVGIRGDTIATVSTEPLQGKRVIAATGLVVSPGFIELHQHGFDEPPAASCSVTRPSETARAFLLDAISIAVLEISAPLTCPSDALSARSDRDLVGDPVGAGLWVYSGQGISTGTARGREGT